MSSCCNSTLCLTGKEPSVFIGYGVEWLSSSRHVEIVCLLHLALLHMMPHHHVGFCARTLDFTVGPPHFGIWSHFLVLVSKHNSWHSLGIEKQKGSGPCGSVGWSILPWTERSRVRLLVMAHTQIVGSIPSQGPHEKATNQLMFLSLCLPPALSLSLKAVGKNVLGWGIIYFLKLFYCSITVVCIFSPLFYPTPAKTTSLPCFHPPPWVCPCVRYSSSWKPFSPLSSPSSPLLLLDCS